MGENTGIGVPTHLNYKQAGYYKEVRRVDSESRVPVKLFCIDEERRDRVFPGGGPIHDGVWFYHTCRESGIEQTERIEWNK